MFVRKVTTLLKPNSISKFSRLMKQEVIPTALVAMIGAALVTKLAAYMKGRRVYARQI